MKKLTTLAVLMTLVSGSACYAKHPRVSAPDDNDLTLTAQSIVENPEHAKIVSLPESPMLADKKKPVVTVSLEIFNKAVEFLADKVIQSFSRTEEIKIDSELIVPELLKNIEE